MLQRAVLRQALLRNLAGSGLLLVDSSRDLAECSGKAWRNMEEVEQAD